MDQIVAPEIIDLNQIRLRRQKVSDAKAIFECASDAEVVRYMDWPICTSIEPLIERFSPRSERWDSGAEFCWVLTLPNEALAIGAISCFVDQHSIEFGYFVNCSYWGNR